MIHRFLETAQRRITNHVLELFALTDEGYLRPIHIIVKLYPFMSGRITIVGYLNSLNKFEGFEKITQSQSTSLEGLTHHYMLGDTNGVISSISKGLSETIGISSVLFNNSDEFAKYTVTI
jgi:hypothetical protein